MNCCNCRKPADCIYIYGRSLGYYCKDCIADKIKEFGITAYIIPLEYLPKDRNNFWPTPCIRIKDKFYSFGKLLSEHDSWIEETNKYVPDMNIP